MPPEITSEVTGIHQSDLILRSAIVAAIADLRANPWLLDYVFASLPKDELTMHEYGEKVVAQAKKWFQSTNIVVFMSSTPVEPKFPCISISLLESTEDTATLGDIHYDVTEDVDSLWEPLTKSFAPISYNAATGIMVVPEIVYRDLVLAEGMVVTDSVGKAHEILEMLDESSFSLAPGTVADFTQATIRPARPAALLHLESVAMKETYQIGCHVQGEPVHLTYLHSILSFVLLRYKQALLEARGFERSEITSSDFTRNPSFDVQQVFSRHINIVGYVRQVWPKALKPKVMSTTVVMGMAGPGPHKIPDNYDENLSWVSSEEVDGG